MAKSPSRTRKAEYIFHLDDGSIPVKIRSPISSHSNYKEACVTYLDVLGFRNLIKQSIQNQTAIIEIRRTLRALRKRMTSRFFKQYRKNYYTPMFRSFGFSDLTVRVIDLDGITTGEDLQFYVLLELSFLASLQRELACRGDGKKPILLRGGMTIGRIDVDINENSDDFLFSPALVRAYELESHTAVFPRIIIDWPIVKAIRSHFQKPELREQIIRQGEDGIYFLDYLAGGSPKMLMQHKEMVQTHLNKLSRQNAHETVVQKYLWLGKYHNSVVGGLSRRFKPDGLTISEHLLSLV